MAFLVTTRPAPWQVFGRGRQSANRRDATDLLRLAAPVTGLALVNMAMSVTDTLMTAGLGPNVLAAVAVASDTYSILFYLAVGCIGGLAPLYAAAHAAGDATRLAELRAAGWLVCALLALPIAAIIWVGPALLPSLGIETALVDRGSGYMRAMALTLPPMLAVAVLRTRLTAIERPGVMLRITLAAVPLNAVFNHAFMYGAFGLPGLGATGAGVSSCLVACLTLIALLVESRRLGDSGLARPNLNHIAEVLRIGLPIGIATLAEVGVYLGATLYAATLSVSDAAAHSIAIRMAGVTYAIYFGLQQAATIRSARTAGAGGDGERIAATALALGAAAGIVLLFIVIGAAAPLASLVLGSSDPEAAQIAILLFGLLALCDLFGPVGAVAAGLLRGIRITRPVMLISLAGNWLIAAPLALLLTRVAEMGAVGIWIGLATGTIVTALLTVGLQSRHGTDRSAFGPAG
ncbi:MAG: hypothetical protein LJE62_15780 [Silicimonas sp.]|nr:hypothetical protein [Silicimonas sp.]